MKATTSIDKSYSFRFGNTNTNTNRNSNDNSLCLCYWGVYECMQMLLLTSKRYRFLSTIAQGSTNNSLHDNNDNSNNIPDKFSERILEPLLVAAVGLLLLKIR